MKKMCKSSHGLHDYVEIQKEFSADACMDKQYGCTYCKKTWWLRYAPNGEPTDLKLCAEIFAKDFIQPGTKIFEQVYGTEQVEKLLRTTADHHASENKKKNMREEIEEFKKHRLKGAKQYTV